MSTPLPELDQVDSRQSVFMRHFTYAKTLLLERQQFGETEREVWNKAKRDHIHPEAARLVLRLSQMDTRRRGAFLRSFDAYRKWARIEAQIELFPDPIGPDTPESPPEDGRQACRLGVSATLNPYDPDDEPDAYEEWGDAWTHAYGAGEWEADLGEQHET